LPAVRSTPPNLNGVVLEIRADLAASRPDDPDATSALAEICSRLGVLLNRLGYFEESEQVLRRALELRSQLFARDTEDLHHRWDVAKSHHDLAHLWESRRRLDEAERESRAALESMSGVAMSLSAIPDMKDTLANLRFDHGRLLVRTKRPGEGERDLRSGLALWTELSRTFPDRPQYLKGMAESYHALALLMSDLGRTDEASRFFPNASYTYAKLFLEFPGVPDYR
jgi:tetratricopeptide (TPR) repeat protein